MVNSKKNLDLRHSALLKKALGYASLSKSMKRNQEIEAEARLEVREAGNSAILLIGKVLHAGGEQGTRIARNVSRKRGGESHNCKIVRGTFNDSELQRSQSLLGGNQSLMHTFCLEKPRERYWKIGILDPAGAGGVS